VAFAEVDRFLDTQVKHYSSGMYVRLAFAVAAHLEPEILIVDEVLAVGDAQFQKKCLGKMKDVTTQGRTVLFVSHNTAALQSICRTGIWLHHGKLVQTGAIGECLAQYLRGGNQEAEYSGNKDKPHITFVRLDQDALSQGRLRLDVGFESPFPLSPPIVGVTLSSSLGQPLSGGNGRMAGDHWQPGASARGVVSALIDRLPLHSDTYRVSVYLGDANQDYDQKLDAIEFDFVSPNFYPKQPPLHVIGQLDLPWQWSLRAGDSG
jgi:lipopolysaccharide transport system ATP-binding protein